MFYVAADFVVFCQYLVDTVLVLLCRRREIFEYLTGIFEVDEQRVVDLIHRFVSNGWLLHIVFIVVPRERSVHIGKFQCRETVHDVTHGAYLFETEAFADLMTGRAA